MRPSQYAQRFALVVGGIVIGLALCEAGLRTIYMVESSRRAARWRSVGELGRGAGPVKLGQIIRPHPERKIGYELLPNLDVTYMGVGVTTNANGFRGPAYPHHRGARSMRIVGLGDSVMFGWGVSYEESFLNILGLQLAESWPDIVVEIINTAVPGYNTVMEVETLKAKGLAYEPDLVILDHVNNDLMPPYFIPHDIDYWTLSRSFLLETVLEVANHRDPARLRRFAAPPRMGVDRDFWVTHEFDPERVPDGLRDMVGLESYRTAMRALAGLSREHGFRVVVTTHQEPPEYVRDICRELAFPLIDTHPRLLHFMQDEGIDDRLGSVLTLSGEDAHPSPLAHRMQAEEIHRHLSNGGLLRDMLEPRKNSSGKPVD